MGQVHQLNQERLTIFSLEAEQAVLGGILVRPQHLDEIVDILIPEHFHQEGHVHVFRTMLKLYEADKPVDLVTVTSLLREEGKLEWVGGVVYLASLSEACAFTGNIPYYAKVVADKALLRNFHTALRHALVECSTAGQEDVRAWILDQEAKLFGHALKGANRAQQFQDLVPPEIERIVAQFEKKTPYLGIPSGFYDLDRMLSGLEKKTLTIIAARPGMGKTALALDMALNMGGEGIPVGFFSMEMGQEQLTQRALASMSMLPFSRVRRGGLEGDEWNRLYDAAANLSNLQVYIDDTGSLSMLELRARARRLRSAQKVQAIFVDYLQLMRAPGAESRTQEIGQISSGLKALSKELELPVIALAQLNRGVESRADKRPLLSDLRESGSIEQDADNVLFIYREYVYTEDPQVANLAELIVRKARNGPTGTVNLFFNDQHVKFASMYSE